MNIDMVQHR